MCKLWKSMVAVGTALCLCSMCLMGCGGSKTAETVACPAEPAGEAVALGTAVIPVQTENPYTDLGDIDEEKSEAWEAERLARIEAGNKIGDGLDAFNQRSIQEFLGNAQGNVAYSPVNLWMALAMLGESTSGDSRQQILELLDVKDTEALKQLVQNVWDATERNDGAISTLLANSLWMSNQLAYVSSCVDELAENYHASTFSGEMGSDTYNQMLRQWLDDNTKGMLTELANQQSFDKDTLLALSSAIYFKDTWANVFDSDLTSPQTFHGLEGDVEHDFLHGTQFSSYYEGETFTALLLSFEGNRGMWMLLPKTGVSVDQVMEEEAAMKLLTGKMEEEAPLSVEAVISIPKFDITSCLDLGAGLQNLGVTDIFDDSKADFSSILSGHAPGSAFLTDALQAARVKINEEGCEAAAFTVFKAGAAMMPERVEFNADRPFLFSILSESNLPLFTGIVNNPS